MAFSRTQDASRSLLSLNNMFRFIHSADWQLGARFTQFGARGIRLREARIATLKRALALARDRAVDAFIIAGDLFEDNQVDEPVVSAVMDLFREYASVPIFILPGNHDPFTGPECVWLRKSFLNPPAHVHFLTQPGATNLGGAILLASPLQQKLSTIDPSLRFVELAASCPANTIKIGVTHGALAIEGKHQPNDFPIALNGATRAGLDYLAVGHWHNWLAGIDGGRIVMPGTPEPDNFANDNSGNVALVEIPGAGQPPQVQPLPVATLAWRSLSFDFASAEASRASLAAALAELSPTADSTVLRVTLTGTASPADLVSVRAWLEPACAPFLIHQLVDRTRIALGAAEVADLQTRHPILAQVLGDIDRLETLATGIVPATTAPLGASSPESPPLTLTEIQALLGPAKIDLAHLTPEFFGQLRQTLFQTLQEVAE